MNPSPSPSPSVLLKSVSDVVSQASSVTLFPCRFFVAWNGVMVMAFTGFPESIQKMKNSMENTLSPHLGTENFGSKWPKVTLGALNDSGHGNGDRNGDVDGVGDGDGDGDGDGLSRMEFMSLLKICEKFTSELVKLSLCVDVTQLSAVVMKCRSLEQLQARFDIDLRHLERHPHRHHDRSAIAASQCEFVSSVFRELDGDVAGYFQTRIVGTTASRISHYRQHHTENTLVAFINQQPSPSPSSSALMDILQRFQRAVDTILPHRYQWFDVESLHCTIRSLGTFEFFQ